MSTLVKLSEVQRQPNKDAVALLEEALADAKAGDLRYVAVIARRRGGIGERTLAISDDADSIELMGLLERAKHLCHANLDGGTQ